MDTKNKGTYEVGSLCGVESGKWKNGKMENKLVFPELGFITNLWCYMSIDLSYITINDGSMNFTS